MPEDAPVNTGAVAWPDSCSADVVVRGMQAKLHQWARENPSRRFGDLYNLVYHPAFLVCAWERVARNKGAKTPGIDKVTAPAVEFWVGAEGYLGRIRDQLKHHAFQPVEVRRVLIPKANGKLRKLGIPTIADRVVQASLKLVLEPIFEADFKPCSYGFRPNRRAHDAIAEIHHFASKPRNYEWVLEADIKACFDEIDHTTLMDRFRARIKDKRVCALAKAFLKAGVMTELGEREASWAGTPQGWILSPLLANVALSALDDHFDRQWHADMGTEGKRRWRRKTGRANWRLVRYADDFVVMVAGEREHAEALREQVQAVLEPLGLRLAPEKTRVVHIDKGFDFLSFNLRRHKQRGSPRWYVYTTVSKKAVQAVKDKIKAATFRAARQGMDLGAVLVKINRILAGWANYFRYAVVKRLFGAIDNYAWHRIMRWLRRKYEGRHRLGMPEMRHRFCDRGWRFAWNGVVFTGAARVRVSRYRYRGYSIPTPWTPTPTATPAGS
jgi:RNA-directed DNA polymerase